jgi:hypothetical protein
MVEGDGASKGALARSWRAQGGGWLCWLAMGSMVLAGWLVGWLVGWLSGCLVVWLAGRLPGLEGGWDVAFC